MKKETKRKKDEIERKRAAYMIAWRDQVINAQKELLEGRAEEARIYAAMLQYCLTVMSGVARDGQGSHTPELRIPKSEIGRVLDEWAMRCDGEGEEYVLRFSKRGTEAQNAFGKEE